MSPGLPGREERNVKTTRNEAEQNSAALAFVGVRFEGLRGELDAIKAALATSDCGAANRAWTELDKRVRDIEASLASNPVVQRDRRAFAFRKHMEGLFEELEGGHPDIPDADLDRFLNAAEAALELLPARREAIESVTAVFKEAVAKGATLQTTMPAS
jgi:hypothetical protein